MTLNPNSKFYRLTTIFRSFKAIYQLSPAEVDAFLKSYAIYDCDWINGQAIKDGHPIDYPEIKHNIIAWYHVINHLCAICQVEKMYIPPTLNPNESVINNQITFEEKFARLLNMKPGDQTLELGCGKGRVAAHLATFSGAHITGINIDQGQLNNALAFVSTNKLTQQCEFINADFNDLPFPFANESFDSIYEIQALSLSRDLDKLFAELYRMLKPGGRLSLLEWVRLTEYDENNPHHVDLMKRIKPLIGAIGTPLPVEYELALRNAGFEIIVSEDPSINQSQGPLIDKSGTIFDKLMPLIKILVKIKLFPEHFITLIDRLGQDVEALCEADKLGLVTTSYHIVAQKND